MITCEIVSQLIDLYLDGELPEPVAAEMKRHLASCAACALEKERLSQARLWLREQVEAPVLDEAALTRIHRRVRAELADMLAETEPSNVLQLKLRIDG